MAGLINAWQLEFSVPEGLSGPSVARTLRRVAGVASCCWVVMHDIEGGGEVLPKLRNHEARVTRVADIIPLVEALEHFEWADFFLCDTVESASSIIGTGSYTPDLLHSIVLLRAVELKFPDFIIYGRSEPVLVALKTLYPSAVLRRSALEELDFPR